MPAAKNDSRMVAVSPSTRGSLSECAGYLADAVFRGLRGAQRAFGTIALARRERRLYKGVMCVLGALGGKSLPRAIPSAELQSMLNSNPTFCSWDPTTATINDSTTGWPYLFANPPAIAGTRLTR